MRNHILAISAILAAMSAPIAAQAQSDTVGIVRGGSVMIDEDAAGIAIDRRPAFREYIVRERVPRRPAGDRRDLLRRAAILRRHALSIHRRERPDRAGRTTYAPHRSGDRVTRLSVSSGLLQRLPDIKAPPGLPPPGRGSFFADRKQAAG